jgi:thiol-disulfide isomerase/thioredoxin
MTMKKYIKQNWTSILLALFVIIMLASPDVKSWVLRQLMLTGLFNAKIESKASDAGYQKAVDFDFANANDAVKQNTSTLRGKVVFINFWASWCPPCRAELPSIEKFYGRVKNNKNIFFLIVSEDDALSVAAQFLHRNDYTIPLYRATSIVPGFLYNGVLPTTIVLDKDGNVRYKHEGFANYGTENFLTQIEDLTKE